MTQNEREHIATAVACLGDRIATPQEPEFNPADAEFQDGQLDYETHMRIRDQVRRYGFEKAREKVAGYLWDEAERSAR